MEVNRVSRRSFFRAAGSVSCAAFVGSATLTSECSRAGERRRTLIDSHLHINHFDRSVQDTLAHLDGTGTDKSIILPLETGEGGVTLKTETVLEAAAQYPDRFIPFCQSDIRQPDVLDRIRAYCDRGCRGLGEQKEHVPFGDPKMERVIALCDELDWPMVFHFQDGTKGYNQGLAEHLERYLKRYKRVRIIGHAQSWWAHISADVPSPDKTLYPKGPVRPGGVIDRLMSDYPNVYADLSAGSGYNGLTRDEEFTAGFLERHRKKLLFASDCPCRDGRGANFKGVCYCTRLQQFLRRMISDEEALDDVFSKNVLRVLGRTA